MQAHKKQVEKRIYKADETIKIPVVKRVKKGVYRKATRSFKISLVEDNKLHGEYLN